MQRLSLLFFLLLVAFSFSLTSLHASEENCSESDSVICSVEAIDSVSRKEAATEKDKARLVLFYAYDCPHCHDAMRWLEEIKKEHENLLIEQYEIKRVPQNFALFTEYARDHMTEPKGVPTIFFNEKVYVGFFKEQADLIHSEISSYYKTQEGTSSEQCRVNSDSLIDVPFLGKLDPSSVSLFEFSVILGLLDGLNPCAMWVLMFLLGLLAHSKSKRRVFLIGSIFVLSSGFVYFAFMSAWFNLFLVIGYSRMILVILASIVIIMGLLNLKDFVFFKKGVSLVIADKYKPKIAEKIRKIIYEKRIGLSILMTIIFAVFVNFIELACTIGLPAIFTKILADRDVGTVSKYYYMVIYNACYVIPLAIIVLIFGFTLASYKLTERQGRILKMISGALMLVLGIVMLISPELLSFS